MSKTTETEIRNERENVTTDFTEIKRSMMKEYYKQLYANKLHNLDNMDEFPEIHNLSTLNHEEIENVNRLLDEFARAATTKYHTLGGLNKRN